MPAELFRTSTLAANDDSWTARKQLVVKNSWKDQREPKRRQHALKPIAAPVPC